MERTNVIDKLDAFLAWGAEELDSFLQAPRKAQEIFFATILMYQNGKIEERPGGIIQEMPLKSLMPVLLYGCTPIEAIFDMAFQTYVLGGGEFEGKTFYFLEEQHEVLIREKRYVVDFFNEKSNLIIECDGHDFHQKTKEQVRKDNEREYDLKMAGYNILRFSGSQIYNRPFECAEKAYLYIEKLVQERGKQNELH